METRHVNYKSDFVLRERFRNAAGELVALPDIDFELRYWVKPNKVFTVKRENGVMFNCVSDGDALLVMFKNHQLGEGFLHHELHLALDNELFSDGVQNVYYPENLNILLWDKMGDCEGILESDIIAAYTRGFAFTFADFTPEQIALLKQPATEAAADARAATRDAQDATRDAQRATEAAQGATSDSQEKTLLAVRAKDDALSATSSAHETTRLTLRAKEDAQTVTAAAQEATRLANLAKDAALLAQQGASEAGQQAASEAQQVGTMRAELEQLAARAEAALAEIPAGLRLVYPSKVTLGNDVAQYVRATVLPVTARQTALFLADGRVCDVAPNGRIMAKQAGSSRVWVVPTAGTQYYKEIYIEVEKPVMRLSGNGIRLDASGNIRLT